MSIVILLLILVLASVIPMGVCAVLARSDARRHQRALALRAFTVATMMTLAVFLAVMVISMFLTSRTSVVGINWIAVFIVHSVILVWSSVTGSLGYFLSYRLFLPAIPEGSYGGDQPVQRLDESGNPYQPPST